MQNRRADDLFLSKQIGPYLYLAAYAKRIDALISRGGGGPGANDLPVIILCAAIGELNGCLTARQPDAIQAAIPIQIRQGLAFGRQSAAKRHEALSISQENLVAGDDVQAAVVIQIRQ